ncbi:PfkB family carbohydrate kinase [Halomonas salipaludis]|uniref:Sugar kinase n=1 Tax=Halomonas salipaludis TaxID=2032625 RepID=A0A2A2ESB3_9GAMM|nr:PfkB family carbohydrate kinase [Halomonas salipaludis]PAU75173.1 sugar kinase [Halomonas salipaludis]
MSATPRLIYTGQAIVDIVMRIDQLPPRGGEVAAASADLAVGAGFNIMAAARRQGMQVLYAGSHGRGTMGNRVRQALADEQIDCLAPVDERRDSGFCIALIDADGERTFVTRQGAEEEVDAKQLWALRLQHGDWLHVSGYSLLYAAKAEALLNWLQQLPTALSVVFDPGPRLASIPVEYLDRLLPRISVWSSNAEETRSFGAHQDLEAALRTIARQLAPDALLIARDGANGCRLLRHGVCHNITGFPVVAVDTNGAGDAHSGVLIAGLAHHLPADEACHRANAAAAIAVSRHGPAMAPTQHELNDFLTEHHSTY